MFRFSQLEVDDVTSESTVEQLEDPVETGNTLNDYLNLSSSPIKTLPQTTSKLSSKEQAILPKTKSVYHINSNSATLEPNMHSNISLAGKMLIDGLPVSINRLIDMKSFKGNVDHWVDSRSEEAIAQHSMEVKEVHSILMKSLKNVMESNEYGAIKNAKKYEDTCKLKFIQLSFELNK